jgi:hypothetical protein
MKEAKEIDALMSVKLVLESFYSHSGVAEKACLIFAYFAADAGCSFLSLLFFPPFFQLTVSFGILKLRKSD